MWGRWDRSPFDLLHYMDPPDQTAKAAQALLFMIIAQAATTQGPRLLHLT